MKKLLTLLAFGAAALSFNALAQPSTQGQAPRVLGPGINAPAYELQAPKDATWPKDLVGTWKGAEDMASGVPAGKLVLAADKSVSLEPDGMFVLKGYWFVKSGNTLVFDTPLQKAESTYRVENKGQTLVLSYSNGTRQKFSRAPEPQPTPKKKK